MAISSFNGPRSAPNRTTSGGFGHPLLVVSTANGGPLSRMSGLVRRFAQEEEGASLAEYALLLGVITVALIGVVSAFRNSIANVFNRTTNTLNSVGT